MLNLSVIAAICLSSSPVQWPTVTAVQTQVNGSTSKLVRVTPAGVEAYPVLPPFTHAKGWAPKVSLNHKKNQALVVLVPPMARHGGLANLYHLDLATGHRRLVAKHVEPRQKALFTPQGPLYVTVQGGDRIIQLGDRELFRETAAMWWPLYLRDNSIYSLVYSERTMKMIRLDLSSGTSRIIRDWKSTPVRDFQFRGHQVVYQSQQALNRFSVEVLDLVSSKNRIAHQSTRPWLTPMFIDAGILIADTQSTVVGSLRILSQHSKIDGPSLGAGAPIPVTEYQGFVAFRLQQKDQQSYLLWHQKTNQIVKLPTGSDGEYLLESIQFEGEDK
ncbi:MAG: hypothetical protein VYC39_14540 [Myxococcota bacterium]|nr:hypothetical protein [Myxococcota bacterium]